MIECKACGYFNLPDTRYCQKCGQYLESKRKKSFFHNLRWGNVAGLGSKGISIAPLTLTLMENNHTFTEKSESKNKSNSIVIPFEDGSWYCPDCGHYNQKYSFLCADCGKYV